MSKYKIVLFFSASMLFVACFDRGSPPNLISEKVMIQILSETHLAEAKVSRMSLYGYDSASVAFKYFQRNIWELYGVDSLVYTQSYNYYAQNPRRFSKMYETIGERIIEMEKETDETKKK